MGKKHKPMFDDWTPEQREIWKLHAEMKDFQRRLEIVGTRLEDPKVALNQHIVAPDPRGETVADDTEGSGKINWYVVFFVGGMGIAIFHTFFDK